MKKLFSIPFYVCEKDFKLKEFIGKGSYASVYACSMIGNEENFVAKLFDNLDGSNIRRMGAAGFVKIPHPNILDPIGIALDYKPITKILMVGLIYPR